MKAARITAHLAGGGLFAGAVAWGLHQQVQYVLGSLFCGHSSSAALWIVTAAALAVLVAGALASWFVLRSFAAEKDVERQDGFRARRFLANLALMGAALFLFAIVLQAVAVLYLPLCTG